MKKKHIIMLRKSLIKPYELTLENYTNIGSDIDSFNKQYLINSIFVYAFSLFEVALNNTLEYYLNSIPAKMNQNSVEFKVSKEIFTNDITIKNLIEEEVGNYVTNLSYKNISEYMKLYCSLFDIKMIELDILERIKEKEASRNLFLHNNLVVNRRYIDTAGKYRRSLYPNTQLKITKEYLFETIDELKHVITVLKEEVDNKYKDYSTLKALKELWAYFFDSPMLNFENYWIINDEKIVGFDIEKAGKYIGNLSSYEKKMLSIWMQHFNSTLNDRYFNFKDIRMWIGMEKEVSFFANIVERHPHIFQG